MQAPEVTEIERLELRFRNRLPAFLVSRHPSYGYGQDVGVEVHIFVFLLYSGTYLIPLGTAILLSLSTAYSVRCSRSTVYSSRIGLRRDPIGLRHVLAHCRLTRPFESHTDCPQQVIPTHGLAQKSHRTAAQRLLFLFLARVGAEEDHGNTRPDFL